MIIGLDISKQSFDAAWSEDSREIHHVFEYNDEGIAAFLQQTPDTAHYVMEATGVYHTRLALRLHDAGRQVSVVNPLVIKRFAQMQLSRVKSDKADARLIQRYGEQHSPSPWQPSSQEIVALKQAHSWLDDLVREQTRLSNRKEALSHQAQPSKFVLSQMAKQARLLKEQIRACEAHLEVTVKKSFPELYRRLQTIPSIGSKTALELIVITEGFNLFASDKALSAYIGISPTTYRSGTSVQGRGNIAKMGRGRARQLLYLCSWTAKRCNRACQALHTRLSEAGKPPKVINIAIAHKLLRQAFAVAMSQQDYCENYA